MTSNLYFLPLHGGRWPMGVVLAENAFQITPLHRVEVSGNLLQNILCFRSCPEISRNFDVSAKKD